MTSASKEPASVSTRRWPGSIDRIVVCTNRTPGLTRSRYGWTTASATSRLNITSSLEKPKANPSALSMSMTSTASPSSSDSLVVSSRPPKPAPSTRTRIMFSSRAVRFSLVQVGRFTCVSVSVHSRAALDRALEIAEAADATALIPRILSMIAVTAFARGQVDDGLAALERGWALARAAQDGPALVWLAANESDALLKLAQFQRAADVALRGLDDARHSGLQSWLEATIVAANAAEALLAVGRTA